MESIVIEKYVAQIQAGSDKALRIYFCNSDRSKRGEMLFMEGTLRGCVRGGPEHRVSSSESGEGGEDAKGRPAAARHPIMIPWLAERPQTG